MGELKKGTPDTTVSSVTECDATTRFSFPSSSSGLVCCFSTVASERHQIYFFSFRLWTERQIRQQKNNSTTISQDVCYLYVKESVKVKAT